MLNQRVRSYDFQPRDDISDSYIEGVVTDITHEMLTIEVDVDSVFPPNHRKVILTPSPGNMIFGEWDGRVTIIPS